MLLDADTIKRINHFKRVVDDEGMPLKIISPSSTEVPEAPAIRARGRQPGIPIGGITPLPAPRARRRRAEPKAEPKSEPEPSAEPEAVVEPEPETPPATEE